MLRDLLGRTNKIVNLEVLEGGVSSFSPGGNLVAVSSDLGYTRVWDTHDWNQVTTLGGVLNAMFTVAFTPDGKRVVTSGGDHEAVKLFDAESWQDVLTLESQGSGMRGVKISPDGNTITWGSVAGNVSIWQASTWEEITAAEAK